MITRLLRRLLCASLVVLPALSAQAQHDLKMSSILSAGPFGLNEAQTGEYAAPNGLPAAALPEPNYAGNGNYYPSYGADPAQASHASNQASDVFGAQLFTGAFSQTASGQFNPDYVINQGDRIEVRLWGAFSFQETLLVDPRGNIFLPHAGPVRVQGVRNQDLERIVQAAVARTFRNNVSSYASLAAAQPVRVYVGGNVYRPGLYNGTSMDGVLHYLDQAGGVDPERGSYLNIQIKRNGQLRSSVNLYDFLLQGSMPMLQLADGDVIFVPPHAQRVSVKGLVANAKRFEFKADQQSVAQLLQLAKPMPSATHVRITRNSGSVTNTEYYPLQAADQIRLGDGDELELTADKKPGTITVRVEGEHDSAQEYVLPYGSQMGDVLKHIKATPQANMTAVQLYRVSVKQRQKELLANSLHNLEMSLLTARSGSSDEARLRKEEAELGLKWVERAKQIEPVGQVQIAKSAQINTMLLENGDRIVIPRKDDLVLVSGEVLFPNAVVYDGQLALTDYINRAGGLTQTADNARVVIARSDGSFEQVSAIGRTAGTKIAAGDQILVLPKVDEKKRQFWKDMTQIMYQIAVSAKVVFGL